MHEYDGAAECRHRAGPDTSSSEPYIPRDVFETPLHIKSPLSHASFSILQYKINMMNSSEIIHSGKPSTHKPNFSHTCSLLSQYLKDNGSFGDLTLGLSANSLPQGASANLVAPQISGRNGESVKAQMTIFYGGKVMVFDEFPAEKVNEIMAMAGAQNQGRSGVGLKSAESATDLVTKPNVGNNMTEQSLPIAAKPVINDLPIARKASLARFLEKRKDRLTSQAPYQASSMGATSKPVEGKGKPWLGLAAQPLNQVPHRA